MPTIDQEQRGIFVSSKWRYTDGSGGGGGGGSSSSSSSSSSMTSHYEQIPENILLSGSKT